MPEVQFRPAITGLGVLVTTACGALEFEQTLRTGASRFPGLRREGREGGFPGAELDDRIFQSRMPGMLRTVSLSVQVAVETMQQAWTDAKLEQRNIAPECIGLVVGGTNFQLRHQQQMQVRYDGKPEMMRPTYGLSFWDSDIIGILSEYFGIRGESYCVGGASAGGAMAILHAARLLQAGAVDVCVAVGPLCDLSQWELEALRNLGTMGTISRPFDTAHDGFVFGEGCAALVLERCDDGAYGYLLGWGTALDAARGPHPNTVGQQRAITAALAMAGLGAEEIDYVNPHGSGSVLGDETELATLRAAGLAHARINTTKALTGHGLTAAGAIEAVATLLQLHGGFLHGNPKLQYPIDPSLRWVGAESIAAPDLRYGLSNSFAFGGLSTALVFAKADERREGHRMACGIIAP